MLLENPKGGYSFIAGGPAFSAGCVAGAGFEIVHAAFRPAMPLGPASRASNASSPASDGRARRYAASICASPRRSLPRSSRNSTVPTSQV